MHKLTCTEQKAPDNNEVQRSLQQCGKNPFAIHRELPEVCGDANNHTYCITRTRVGSENLLAGKHGLPKGWVTVIRHCVEGMSISLLEIYFCNKI